MEEVKFCPVCGSADVFKYLNEDGDHEWLCTNIVEVDLTRCMWREPVSKEEAKSQ